MWTRCPQIVTWTPLTNSSAFLSALIGPDSLLFPMKKTKVSQKARLPCVEKRDPEWTETKMREQFVDKKGNFNWLKDQLAQQLGWSLTAIKSVRKKASIGRPTQVCSLNITKRHRSYAAHRVST